MARIPVRVVPRSRKNEIRQEGDGLKIWLNAPPVDGAANEALLALRAERLHLPGRALRIARGATSRQKVLEIDGLTVEEVMAKLQL